MPAVLSQTGYLTIKEVWGQDMGMIYDLGFPNREVSMAFACLTHNVGAWVSEGL